MIFTDVTIKNMFGIKNVEIPLSYPRKTPNSPVKQYLREFNNINYKKVNIILGGNATGKTSIGKSLCFVQNFMKGVSVSLEEFSTFHKVQYEKDKPFGFDVVFISGEYMYGVSALFKRNVELGNHNLIHESWRKIPLKETGSYTTHKEHLYETSPIYIYGDKNEGVKYEVRSAYLSSVEGENDLLYIRDRLSFSYHYSNHSRSSLDFDDISIGFFESILKSFDPSIQSVSKSTEVDHELLITFSNNHIERIDVNNLKYGVNSVLSAGTYEIINLVTTLYYIKNTGDGVYYIDEKMAFSHSNLEKTIINLILEWIDDKDAQVFITTHNKELLDIGLPVYNYMFTVKNYHSSEIEIINPELSVHHKSRSMRTMVEDDVFGVAPHDDILYELIE